MPFAAGNVLLRFIACPVSRSQCSAWRLMDVLRIPRVPETLSWWPPLMEKASSFPQN